MTKSDPKHDHDDHHDHANDNGTAVAPAPAGGALAALTALGAALNSVDVASVIGRSGHPMLQFKAREADGTWAFGQRRTIPEPGSLWAVNPMSFQWGYVCFGDNNKRLDDRLVSISQPKPDPTKLPDTGFAWQEEWAVGMKCVSGADAGVEVIFKTTTTGGAQAVVGLIGAVRDRLNGGQHDGKISPIVRLEKDSYAHGQYGRQWIPIMEVVDWMSLSGPGPTPAPTPATPSEPQPRRRRVG